MRIGRKLQKSLNQGWMTMTMSPEDFTVIFTFIGNLNAAKH